jgi:putative beta-barrel porin BBP2
MRRDHCLADLRKLLIALISATGVVGDCGTLAAQERERQAQPSPQPPPEVGGAGGGVQFFAATQAGFDSNLDNRFLSRPSPFEMLQLGTSGSYKPTDSSAYSFYLSSRDFWYNSLDVSQRYDIDAAVGARYDFSPTTALKIGSSYYKDAISLDRYDYYKGFADLINEGEIYRLRVKLDSLTEVSTNQLLSGTVAPNIFAVANNKAFDFTKNGATASLLMMQKQMVAPFIVGNYADVDYFEQVPNPSINRTAWEYWAAAGARVTFSPDFSVDLGARYNHRNFDDLIFTQFSSAYPDIRFTWHAYDGWTVRGIVERQIVEPTTSFGLADDLTTYELDFDKRFDRWTFSGRAFLNHVKPIGDPFNYYKYNWFVGLGYDIDKNTKLFAEYYGRWVDEKVSDLAYERTRVGAGVRVSF